MRVLVTGAAGFIGSNLVKHLLSEDHQVCGIDDLRSGNMKFLENLGCQGLSFYTNSFSSPDVLSLIRKKQFDTVVHLAATPRVGFSIKYPLKTFENNVSNTMSLIDACVGNIERFVFSSSSSVYGDAEEYPTHEGMSKKPKSPYSLQKSYIEDVLKMYSVLYDFDSAALRFFSVFGPNSLGNSSYSTVIGAWLTAIKNNQLGIMRGDGNQTRDFCYVDNVTDAISKACTSPRTLRGEVINVGCGSSYSLQDVKRYIKNTHFPEFETQTEENSVFDVVNTHASIEKAEKLLAYKPIIELYDGIDKTVSWYNDNWDWVMTL